MAVSQVRSLNPWLSIWLRPRETIRDIVDTRITYRVHMLAMLYGVELVLNRSIRKHVGDMIPWSWILIGAMVLGPFGWFGPAVCWQFCVPMGGA